MEAGKKVKEEGADNDLLDRIAADPMFHLTREQLEDTMDPNRYVGRAPEQVDRYLANVIAPILDAHKDMLGVKVEIDV